MTTNPTEALDAVEQALQTVLSRYGNERHFGSGRQADEINKEHTVKLGFETLTHLATLKQQVAELVAFREAHQWERPLPSEALYSFAGWLTGRNEAVTFSANHESGIAAELVNAFCKANDFDSPRDGIWPGNVKHPPAADGGQPHDH